MARVIPDLIDGEVRRTPTGNTARRVFRVEELSGSAGARLYNATQASGVPHTGDAHPVIPDLTVNEVRASASGDPAQALVEVSYAAPGAGSGAGGLGEIDVTIGSDLITEEITRDVNGDLITTSHSYQLLISGTSATGFWPGTPGVNQTITNSLVHRVEVQRPTFSVIYTRAEKRAPLGRARAYAGHVNTSRFLGEGADSWLCNVESSQEAVGLHRVRYTFTLNTKGWQARISHQNAGVIPDNIGPQNGERNVQVYERAEFNRLNLPRV